METVKRVTLCLNAMDLKMLKAVKEKYDASSAHIYRYALTRLFTSICENEIKPPESLTTK